jgi:hypothetical protein
VKRLLPILAALACVLSPAAAFAAWSSPGAGKGYTKARSMGAGTAPTTSVTGRSVTVSWTAPASGPPVDGYIINRYSSGGVAQSVGANCSGTVTGLSCTESNVPSGTWTYTVTPRQGNWRGAESASSSSVTVSSPTLTLSGSTTLSSLPSTLTGSLSGFTQNQTVTFRLDNASTGTVLTGTTTPTPIPANGQASVSVTIPSGVANGSHTLYAVGSGGDTASAGFTVAVPTTITTSAWDVKDSSGGGEAPSPDGTAFAEGLVTTTGAFSSAFASTRYLDYDLNGPLEPGSTVSGANFNFRFTDTANNRTACFYFEVRAKSSGAVLGTHGSSASPIGCVTGQTQQTFTTPLSEVTTASIANNLRIRVFMKESAGGAVKVDQATVSLTTGSSTASLYEISTTDSSTGTATTTPWGLATAGDGAAYSSALAWTSAFSSTRYISLPFPAYVPSSGVSLSSVSFKHSYRSLTTGQTCWYFEVYSGATLLGTHGSAANPVSCNSTTSYVTDNTPLPEVTTVAQANNLSVKMYVKNSGALRTQDDLDELTISYLR